MTAGRGGGGLCLFGISLQLPTEVRSPNTVATPSNVAVASFQVRPPGALSSQFACTYREEAEPPLSRVLEFPSGSQIPSCIHPAPRRPPGAPRRPLGAPRRPLASGEEEEEEETGRRAGVSGKPPHPPQDTRFTGQTGTASMVNGLRL